MTKFIITQLMFIIALGCNETSHSDVAVSGEAISAPAVYESVENEKSVEASSDEQKLNENNTSIEQKIIKTGNFTFETSSVNETAQEIKKWVLQNKGFIQSDQTYKDYNRLTRNLVIRVPTQGFQTIVDSLKSGVKAFDTENIELQDVTEEFVDIQARMKAKKDLETRYLQLLNKANSVKDMLEIEAQLAHIREEIEAQEGRLKYLQNRVSFSTLNINFYEITEFEKAPSQGYFSRLGKAFVSGFKGIGEFIIGLVTLWPLFVVVGVAFFWIWNKRKNKKIK